MLAEGTVLDDRYTIVRLLAEGGMSRVYEVEDVRLKGRLALKVMRPLIADEDAHRTLEAQFTREGELLARLSHPNLPRVTDHFVHEGQRCLVEELVEGDTLEARSPCAERDVIDWATQICDALEYLHENGVIYRDLKPSNCMLTPRGVIKLIDFGIARVFTIGKARDTVLMGTPGFAAPEQYGREQTDARADIYALGVLMHHLLTGYDPALTPFILPPPRELDATITPALERVITKALALDPTRRWQSVDALRDALTHLDAPLDDAETFAYPEQVAPRASRYVGAALVSSGVTAVGGVLLTMFAAPVSAIALFYGPAWMAVLCYDFWRRRRLSRVWIRVEPDGLRFSDGRREVAVRWEEVEGLSFRHEWLSGCRLAHLETARGAVYFHLDASRVLDQPALRQATRLCNAVLARVGVT